MKNTNNNTYTYDLLKSEDYKKALQFDAVHGIEIKGGHLPYYTSKINRRRAVDHINLLNGAEKLALINGIFTSKN